MPSPLRIHGLVAATLTAFNGTGGLDLSVVPQQQAYLKSTGVNWTFVSGTTGESLSLTVNERKSLYEAWVKAGSQVIAHCGAESVVDARELAAHAAKVGAKASASCHPRSLSPHPLKVWRRQLLMSVQLRHRCLVTTITSHP